MLVILGPITVLAQSPSTFKTHQLNYSRVKLAYNQKWSDLKVLLASKNIKVDNIDLFIRIFKKEKELELWVKNHESLQYTFIKKIEICASSGVLGPKRQEGDGQVPEGIYEVAAFNPSSSYYLALKVSYPNKSDRILKTGAPGGDIMIHGNCVTIGCIPLKDEPIKEVYVLAVEAKSMNRPIRIEIYPCKFNTENDKLLNTYSKEKINFWNNLRPAYCYFEKNKAPCKYTILSNGKYNITSE